VVKAVPASAKAHGWRNDALAIARKRKGPDQSTIMRRGRITTRHPIIATCPVINSPAISVI
jgi:hypothetical protein